MAPAAIDGVVVPDLFDDQYPKHTYEFNKTLAMKIYAELKKDHPELGWVLDSTVNQCACLVYKKFGYCTHSLLLKEATGINHRQFVPNAALGTSTSGASNL